MVNCIETETLKLIPLTVEMTEDILNNNCRGLLDLEPSKSFT